MEDDPQPMTTIEPRNTGKPWYKSKTIIFNIVSLIVLVSGSPQAAELLPLFPPDWQEGIARAMPVILVAGNAYLRMITNEPITKVR